MIAQLFQASSRWLDAKGVAARGRLALILIASLATVLAVTLIAMRLMLTRVFYIDQVRSLFPWDAIPAVPKLFSLSVYIVLLGAGFCLIVVVLYLGQITESRAAQLLRRMRAGILLPAKFLPWGLAIAWLPMLWSLFVVPFNIPNEFLALDTFPQLKSGDVVSTLNTLEAMRLEGLVVPRGESNPPTYVRVKVADAHRPQEAQALARTFPESFWFDPIDNAIEVHRISDIEQYSRLLALADRRDLAALQGKFKSDLRDSIALATREYSTEEKEFLAFKKKELERSLVLGRFFYHHAFIFEPSIARVQDNKLLEASQYGLGLTQAFSSALAQAPPEFAFNAYLLLLYSSYPLYFLAILWLSRRLGFSKRQQLLASGCVLLSYLISDLETIRLGVGLAPWRHVFDVLLLFFAYSFLRREGRRRYVALLTVLLLGIYWSREMGMFSALAVFGVLSLRAVLLGERSAWFIAVVTAALSGWVFLATNPHAQTAVDGVLLGANTPDLPLGLIAVVSLLTASLVAAWSARGRRALLTPDQAGLWAVSGVAFIYSAAFGVYLIYYPRPHHLVPIVPVFAVGVIAAYRLLIMQRRAQPSEFRPVRGERLALSTVSALLFLFAGLRGGEAVQEFRHFAAHIAFDWKFPAATLKSTAEPKLLLESVEMIRSRNSRATVDILSPWEVVLLPLAGKGKSGPFTVSFDSMLTERELKVLARHLARPDADTLFVDTRLVEGRYELPLSEEAYFMNRYRASVLRVRAHVMLRETFQLVRHCYELDERGPLISAWKRKSGVCSVAG